MGFFRGNNLLGFIKIINQNEVSLLLRLPSLVHTESAENRRQQNLEIVRDVYLAERRRVGVHYLVEIAPVA